jgi:intein/homing endonuclease
MATNSRKLFNLMLNVGMELYGYPQQTQSAPAISAPAVPEIGQCPPVLETLRLINTTGGGVVFIVGERFTGKCLKFDTPLCTSTGKIIKIEDWDGEALLSLDQHYRLHETTPTTLCCLGEQDTVTISLRSGKELTVTPEHRFLTVTGWVRADSLSSGSRIATPRIVPFFGSKPMPEHEIKVLAYLLGDGCLKRNIGFTKADPEVIADFREAAEAFPNTMTSVVPRQGTEAVGIRPAKLYRKNDHSKNAIAQFTQRLGIYGKLAKDKLIPDCVFTLPREQLVLFLNRLYATDSHFSKRTIDYYSTSKMLCFQLQHLLLRLGIISSVREKRTQYNNLPYTSYVVVIEGGEDILRFCDIVGRVLGKSQEQEALHDYIAAHNSFHGKDSIPREVWDSIIWKTHRWDSTPGSVQKADIGRALGYKTAKSGRTSLRYGPSRQKLLAVGDYVGSDHLVDLATSDVFWDEVSAVSPTGKHRVYDLCMEPDHNFVANDTVVHNSTLALRLGELIGRPVYAVSPEDDPPAGVTAVSLKDIGRIPQFSTLILDDAQVYAGSQDYWNPWVKKLNAIIPLVRKRRKLVLIIATQVSALVEKHVMQADLSIFKPLTAHYEVLERGPVVKLGRISEPYFAGLSREQQQRVAVVFGRYPPWTGMVTINRPQHFRQPVVVFNRTNDEDEADAELDADCNPDESTDMR